MGIIAAINMTTFYVGVILLVVAIAILIKSVWFSDTSELVRAQKKVQSDLNAMRTDLSDDLVKSQEEISFLRAKVLDSEKANDSRDKKISELQIKIEAERKETKEVIHSFYIWITDAVKRFQALNEEPPELPEDFIIFHKKYTEGE